ncbi:hypothetical protein JNUCC83_11475 [Vagococcus sp. JNUCC 83]
MQHKEIDELYRENTSRLTKIYGILFKIDVGLFPFLFIGMLFGKGTIELYSSLIAFILAILLFFLFIFDAYFRIKKGKQREKDEKRI